MPLVNNYFDLSAGNSIKEIRKMETEMSKLLKTSKSVAEEINEISNIKININLNTKDIEKNISNVSNSVKSLGTDLVENMSKVNGAVSKLDNNMSSRGGVNGDFSMLYEGIASYASQFSDTLLPSGASSILSGAANGFAAGMLTGNPVIAIASTIIGAGAEWALSEVKKKTDRRNQRVSFGSSILKTYLPKIAMGSLNYASDMEQSVLNYNNLLGSNNGDEFIASMLEISNKGFYKFSDLENAGIGIITAGFDKDMTKEIFNATGNASAAKGNGVEGALKLIESLKQMKKSGNITEESLNVFKDMGIDAYKILYDSQSELCKNTGVTQEKFKELVSKGLIPTDDAIKALVYTMNDDFKGSMEKQGQTFNGLISRMKDSVNQIILGPLGKGFIEGIKESLNGFADFFGLGTKGFEELGEKIYSFGKEIGDFAGKAIVGLKNVFSELFNDEKFKNADVPAKILMIYDEIKANIDQWYEKNRDSLFEKMGGFFTEFLTRVGKESDFKNAVQDLWLSISPDEDTIKKMFDKIDVLELFNKKVSPLIKLISFIFSIRALVDNFTKNSSNNIFGVEIDSTEQLTKFGGTGVLFSGAAAVNRKAIGLNRVPYDYYPALLHEGEAVLRRTEADNYRNGVGKGVIISKIADTIVVKDEADMYKIANILVSEIEKAGLVYGGAM